ncbi:MAG: DNA-protecting protein DprA [Gemmatimonadetes bacterium]|nr:DNA-protecting protein DprA [Gemmatimonadota bacterium]
MTDGELRALLRLRCLPGLGDRRLARLLTQQGSAEKVLGMSAERLGADVPPHQGRAVAVRVERALRLIELQPLELLAVHWPGYPVELQELPDPPVLLFARGDGALIGKTSVAVVGTRRPTEYGIGVTEQLVGGLARAGIVVWSGLARGIDSVAHRTALAAGGATVAVLGSGIDVPYPREHAGLLEEIAEGGLVLSEFLPGEPPLPHHFPQRNRILARLAHGVLVVEARPDGGALITAEAGSASRPIMAVPGPIGRLTSIGPNRLIQDGAKLVLEVADVLEELGGPLNAAAARGRPSARRHWQRVDHGPGGRCDPAQLPLGGERLPPRPRPRTPARRAIEVPGPAGAVLAALGTGEALHVDDIAARCGGGTGETLAHLLELEVAGLAEHTGGKRYRLTPRPDRNRHRLPALDPADDPPPGEASGN